MKDLSNENVIHIRKEGIGYLQFRKLLEYSDVINHAYSLGIDRNYRTTRAADSAPLSQEEYNKAKNDYKDLCEEINANYINVAKPNQAHTRNIFSVDKKVETDKPDFNLREYDKTDGLVTNKKNIILATTNADCILYLIYDPKNKIIANVHSGWRGTYQRIIEKTIDKMKELGSRPEDIIICICPSIRKCCFEVENDVKEMFQEKFSFLKNINKHIINGYNPNKFHIDTVEINNQLLQNKGIKKENIYDSGICSVCNSDIIHSYRIEKSKFKLGTAIISL